jgi:hypothetical protein
LYAHSAKVDDYDIFWGKLPVTAKASPAR